MKNPYLIMITIRKVQEFGKKKFGKTDEINILIEIYKTMESKLIDNRRPKNDIVELWFKYLINLNNINTNL